MPALRCILPVMALLIMALRIPIQTPWIVGADTTTMRAHYRAFEHAVDSAGIRQIRALNRFDAAHRAGETNLFLLHDNHWNCRGISVIARDMPHYLNSFKPSPAPPRTLKLYKSDNSRKELRS